MRSRRSTGSSSSAAASLTGRGAGRPREPGRSGCGTTASTSCAAATAWRAGTAKSAVPQKTMRIRMPPGAVRLRSADELALERRGLLLVGAVPLLQRALDHLGGEEDAVEVIDLMLDGAGEQPVALDADLLAVAVQPPGHDTVAALHLADQSGDGEAALVPRLLALAAHHLGVGELGGGGPPPPPACPPPRPPCGGLGGWWAWLPTWRPRARGAPPGGGGGGP